MKTYQEFINETLIKIETEEDTFNSVAYSGSKYDILKKSKDGTYTQIEIEIFEMMKKRPDLFCKIHKILKTQVLSEKLDLKSFIKDYDKNIEGIDKYPELWFIEDNFEEKFKMSYLIKMTELPNYQNINKFLKKFMNLKIEIFEYFYDLMSTQNIYLDLHAGNFGYIKGSKEIRCFDPIIVWTKNFK